MKWEGQRQSDNIEDRRSGGAGRAAGKLGISTIVLGLIASYFLGINPMQAIQLVGGVQNKISPATQTQGQVPDSNTQDAQTAFVRTVVADTEDVWGKLFAAQGARYQQPILVLYSGATPTACGQGQAAMGPFYCPNDQKVYLDMNFFDTLSRQLGAPGEFARAYVVAHEVGHHVQNLLGVTERTDQARQRVSKVQGNAISVRVELQADCLAGVWAHHSQQGKGWLEQGDLEEALNAATKIGDDTLQKQAQGRVVPESFTHGSSVQRQRWFDTGLKHGSVRACDTFAARQP